MKNQEFNQSDVLTSAELVKFYNCESPIDKAKLIYEKIKPYVIIKDKNVYRLQTNITFKDVTKHNQPLGQIISELISKSHDFISITDKSMKPLSDKGFLTRLTDLKVIRDYIPFIESIFLEQDIALDYYFNELHFNNGYVDITTGELKDRDPLVHRVTHVIKHDYSPSAEKDRQDMMSLVKKIFNNEDDLKCIMTLLGIALTGQSTKHQYSLSLYGKGSSGKSTLLDLCRLSMPEYANEFGSDMLSGGTSNTNKTLHVYKAQPQLRYSIINEASTLKINSSLYKKLIDGKLNFNTLYEDGETSMSHQTLFVLMSNTIINIDNDSGNNRRILVVEMESLFTDDISLVDESKNIYLKDKDLLTNFGQNIPQQLAWIDILIKYAMEYKKTGIIPISENFNKTKELIIGVNDPLADFIEQYLDVKITLTVDDRISKDQMLNLFNFAYPSLKWDHKKLLTGLKEKGIKYSSDLRIKGPKGCYTHVKLLNISTIKSADEVI